MSVVFMTSSAIPIISFNGRTFLTICNTTSCINSFTLCNTTSCIKAFTLCHWALARGVRIMCKTRLSTFNVEWPTTYYSFNGINVLGEVIHSYYGFAFRKYIYFITHLVMLHVYQIYNHITLAWTQYIIINLIALVGVL